MSPYKNKSRQDEFSIQQQLYAQRAGSASGSSWSGQVQQPLNSAFDPWQSEFNLQRQMYDMGLSVQMPPWVQNLPAAVRGSISLQLPAGAGIGISGQVRNFEYTAGWMAITGVRSYSPGRGWDFDPTLKEEIRVALTYEGTGVEVTVDFSNDGWRNWINFGIVEGDFSADKNGEITLGKSLFAVIGAGVEITFNLPEFIRILREGDTSNLNRSSGCP